MCVHDSRLYVCTNSVEVADAWDSSDWLETTIDGAIKPLANQPTFDLSTEAGVKAGLKAVIEALGGTATTVAQ